VREGWGCPGLGMAGPGDPQTRPRSAPRVAPLGDGGDGARGETLPGVGRGRGVGSEGGRLRSERGGKGEQFAFVSRHPNLV